MMMYYLMLSYRLFQSVMVDQFFNLVSFEIDAVP